jgi:hypothetical protein
VATMPVPEVAKRRKVSEQTIYSSAWSRRFQVPSAQCTTHFFGSLQLQQRAIERACASDLSPPGGRCDWK